MGLGKEVDHVAEFVSCWRPAAIECAFDGVYQKYCALSMQLMLIMYAMCSISLSYEIRTGKYMADEGQLALHMVTVLLLAMDVGKYVQLVLADARCRAMIESERRISELIDLE
jgi:hypothetical protein